MVNLNFAEDVGCRYVEHEKYEKGRPNHTESSPKRVQKPISYEREITSTEKRPGTAEATLLRKCEILGRLGLNSSDPGLRKPLEVFEGLRYGLIQFPLGITLRFEVQVFKSVATRSRAVTADEDVYGPECFDRLSELTGQQRSGVIWRAWANGRS
ncbi:hypothetical protein CMUS01_07998 [Colletotrichum musicola]|uniref:Uncharacterized protein n=1 Tax=Colletotrichum musicola TaxID=2175873 RepID=A0A8H6KF43_9PEZI|nr:hypothetical protein CMUS01_07998 [Colletotrichum musicola]